MSKLVVEKASGERIGYSRDQLMESLLRAGASAEQAERITRTVEQIVIEGVNTQKIWRLAHGMLQRSDRASAMRYGLKQAIMRLGPTGFPFEKYIAALLSAYGYQEVRVGTHIPGQCVLHEVDITARKGDRHFMIEAKYHNQPGLRSDVKVALYTHARFTDIRNAWERDPSHTRELHEAWLVTNTKCTSDAVQYANCVGLNIISWRYPKSGGLEELIETRRLYPVTILPLSARLKTALVQTNVMLVRNVLDMDLAQFADTYSIAKHEIASLRRAAELLCESGC